MKSFIFKKTFEEIFTPQRIAWEAQKLNLELHGDLFDFAPHKSFLLPKNNEEFRTISIPDKKVKIIQRILYEELSHVITFSDRNYAYQKNKSPLKAINRVKSLLPHHTFVIKADIDNFFDTIDHNRLLHKLQKIIEDKKILYLITLFLKNGSLFHGTWHDKLEGVYQGDVLSPFLANVYLHSFDISLQKRDIQFVRYADDMILFAKNFEEARSILKFVRQRLKIEKLTLDEEKTYIRHKMKRFEYLGVIFDLSSNTYSIDNDHLMKKISTISKETKQLTLPQTIEKLNEHIRGFLSYYSQLINNQKQLQLLQKRADEIIIDKIVKAKLSKTITRKKEFSKLLNNLLYYFPQDRFPAILLEIAYEKIKLLQPTKAAIKTIENKKRTFYKKSLITSELIISKPATFLSFQRGKIAIRTKGEPTHYVPFHKIKRILITTIQSSISTYLIYKCAQEKIDIDFIYENEPFALITFYKTITKKLHLAQLKLILSTKSLSYAQSLHYAKAKNQLNLLKYFNKRRDNEQLDLLIDKIERLIPKIKNSKDSQSLMALEGQISQLYWNGFRIIINFPNFQRTHKNSTDPINQALNYGYAILYNRIQSALIKEGLNIYYSFLHATDYKNPTLVYDFIEPFRQPIVDREIISIITKGTKLHTTGNKLTQKSKKIVVQNIQERLGSLTMTRYGKTSYINLIQYEAQSLRKSIEEEKQNYRFYIARY